VLLANLSVSIPRRWSRKACRLATGALSDLVVWIHDTDLPDQKIEPIACCWRIRYGRLISHKIQISNSDYSMSAIIDTLTTTLQAAPGNWQYRLALIEALVTDRQVDEACRVLEGVTVLPEDIPSQMLAAKAYGILEPKSGIEILDGIILTDPTCARAYLEKASLLCGIGEVCLANRHYEAAIKLDPNLADPDLAAILTDPDFSTASGVTTSQHTLPKASAPAQSPEPAEVYYPSPGELPTITLAQALESHSPRTLVSPENIPDLPSLEYDQDVVRTETVHTERIEFYERLNNVDVYPAGHLEGVIYDFQKPDDTIFQPTITDEEIYVGALVTETGQPVASLQASIRRHRALVKQEIGRKEWQDKSQAVVASLILVAGICGLLLLVVTSIPTRKPPQIIARVVAPTPKEDVKNEELRQKRPTPAPAASSLMASLNVVTAASVSDVSALSFDSPMTGLGAPAMGNSFGASLDFGSPSGGGSTMFFGTKTKGETAVVFDVSGSMYQAVPGVVKEIKRAFKKAPVVAVMGCRFAPRKADEDHKLIDCKDNPQLLNWAEINGAGVPDLRDGMKKALFSLDITMSLSEETVDAKLTTQNMGRAIELLVNQPKSERPSTIFIFADFQDPMDNNYLSGLKSLLKRRGTKIIFYQAMDKFAKNQTALEKFIDGIDGEIKIGL